VEPTPLVRPSLMYASAAEGYTTTHTIITQSDKYVVRPQPPSSFGDLCGSILCIEGAMGDRTRSRSFTLSRDRCRRRRYRMRYVRSPVFGSYDGAAIIQSSNPAQIIKFVKINRTIRFNTLAAATTIVIHESIRRERERRDRDRCNVQEHDEIQDVPEDIWYQRHA